LFSLFTSISINSLIKDTMRRPRPFLTEGWGGLRHVRIENVFVDTVSVGDSFSFPSGHSQCAGTFFTAVALWLKKGWGYAVAAVLILGVMVSRVYLGVHFPSDVIVGATLGILSSVVCYWFFNRFYEKKIWMFSAVLLLSLPTLFLTPSSDTVKIIGVGIGAIAGLVWEVKSINFTVDGTFWHRVLRMLLGGAIILVLRMGLKVIFPETMFFDGLRYGFMGVAATGFIPWIFTRYKL
ncbi:MAG: phosphatase PAP2 family protein, partial [Angelakisella sp.]